MELDTNAAAWAALAAFFMPPVMAVINQPKWSAQLKSLLAFAVSVGVAFVSVWVAGDFNAEDIISSVLVTLTVAQSTYHGFWKPTGIAPGIEAGTTPGATTQQVVATEVAAVDDDTDVIGDDRLGV